MTIFILLIIYYIFYFCGMIWATIMDKKDLLDLELCFIKDNDPEDKYLYEILVETGPFANHATSSKGIK